MEKQVVTDRKAVDYFEVEAMIHHLNYLRDSEMMMDQIIPHLNIFYWQNLGNAQQMKVEVIPYNATYWEINSAKNSSEKFRRQTSSGSKGTQTYERGKSQTPNVKAEVSKMSGLQQQFLLQKGFGCCKKHHLCFMCKVDSLEIIGSLKFHLSHLPQKTNTKRRKRRER